MFIHRSILLISLLRVSLCLHSPLAARQVRGNLHMSMACAHRRLVMPSLAEIKKGKVIMIHGWAQNADVMKFKTKGLTRKLNQAGYDCVFLEGPHSLPLTSIVNVEGIPVEVENGKRENARAWFLLSRIDPADASLSQSRTPMSYIGLDSSLSILEQELHSDDEFVSILGFSQGGVFAHMLATLATNQLEHNPFRRIQCAIIASGFASQHVGNQDSKYDIGKNLAESIVHLPSLHLIGENDMSVNPTLSVHLAGLFQESEILYHEKGHIIPQKSAQCATVISFLEKIRARESPVANGLDRGSVEG